VAVPVDVAGAVTSAKVKVAGRRREARCTAVVARAVPSSCMRVSPGTTT